MATSTATRQVGSSKATGALVRPASFKPTTIDQLEITVYGLCVLREREPLAGVKLLDILLVGDPGTARKAAHGHDPKIVYDAVHETQPPSNPVERSMLHKKIDLTWLPTDTKATPLHKNVVNLKTKITKEDLPANPELIPSVTGYLTLLGGGRIHTDNPKGAGWGLMDRNSYELTAEWETVAWRVTWSAKVRGDLTNLGWSIESLPGDPNPTTVSPLYPDKNGRIALEVWNLPHGKKPPSKPGPLPGKNEYVPHFEAYQHLYANLKSAWPYLVYDPQEGVQPTPMDEGTRTTSYTCVPSGGK